MGYIRQYFAYTNVKIMKNPQENIIKNVCNVSLVNIQDNNFIFS